MIYFCNFSIKQFVLRFLVLFCLIGFSSRNIAQEIVFKTYNINNSKIPDNIIKTVAVYNDEIWFATGDCFLGGVLVKFSKNKFTIFDTINHQLPDKFITYIYPESSKKIWIGTRYQGLWMFDGEKKWNKFKSNEVFPDKHITSIFSIKTNEIWIGTTKGLVYLKDNLIKIFNSSNSKLPNNQINFITKDWENNIWIATDKGLVKILKENNWQIFNSKNTPLYDDLVTHIAVNDERKEVWVAFWGGLACLKNDNWQIFDCRNSKLPAYAEYRPTCNGNLLWISTDQGLYRYDYKNWNSFTPNNSSIPDFFVNKTIIDKKGNVWAASQSGLVKITNSKK